MSRVRFNAGDAAALLLLCAVLAGALLLMGCAPARPRVVIMPGRICPDSLRFLYAEDRYTRDGKRYTVALCEDTTRGAP